MCVFFMINSVKVIYMQIYFVFKILFSKNVTQTYLCVTSKSVLPLILSFYAIKSNHVVLTLFLLAINTKKSKNKNLRYFLYLTSFSVLLIIIDFFPSLWLVTENHGLYVHAIKFVLLGYFYTSKWRII